MAFRFDDDWSADDSESESFDLDQQDWGEESFMHSNFQMLSGNVTVGAKDDDAESMRVGVEFPQPFIGDVPPTVFCQAMGEHGSTAGDVFGCTLIDSGMEGFEVNVGRGGEVKSWDQEVQLNWVAIVSDGNPMVSCMTVEVGGSDGTGSTVAQCQFPQPLPQGMQPFLMATAVGEDYTDTFAVTVKKFGRHRASFNIARMSNHHEEGGLFSDVWGQNLRLNVCYFPSSMFPCLRVHIGADEENNMIVRDGIDFGVKLRRRPLPFVMAQLPTDAEPHWGDTFGVSVANCTREDLQLNVYRAEHDSGWGAQVRAVICLIP